MVLLCNLSCFSFVYYVHLRSGFWCNFNNVKAKLLNWSLALLWCFECFRFIISTSENQRTLPNDLRCFIESEHLYASFFLLYMKNLQNNQVIELSDDDDPEVVVRCDDDDVDKKEEDEVQAEFCELRDAENLPDAEGRICIRRGASEAESFYLAPHIARVIKPHQVTFLF